MFQETTLVVLPYCRDRHWYLVALVPATRVYHYYTCNPNEDRDAQCKATLEKQLQVLSNWLGSDRPWVEETVACAPQAADASGVSICATAYALARNLNLHDDVPPAQDVVLRRYFLHLLSTHGDMGEDDAPASDADSHPPTAAQKRQIYDLMEEVCKRPKRK
jgi:hypothetical protein